MHHEYENKDLANQIEALKQDLEQQEDESVQSLAHCHYFMTAVGAAVGVAAMHFQS